MHARRWKLRFPFFALGSLTGAAFLPSVVVPTSAQSLTVTTLAGQRDVAYANVDGLGAAARFNSHLPGIVVDPAGNLFVVDANNRTIRRVTPAGQVTTLAGTAGVSGYHDATGVAAQFEDLRSFARDAAGNLYVGDRTRFRKISPTAVVTTLVRQPGLASEPMPDPSRRWSFSGGAALAIDPVGNLYVGDYTVIRKISFNGVETVLSGSTSGFGTADGVGSAARFGIIGGIALDTAGNLFVTDAGNHSIRKVTPAGLVSTFAGLTGTAGFADGLGPNARFNMPGGIAIDSAGNLYVAEINNAALRRITPAGLVTTIIGGAGLPRIARPDGRSLFPDGVGANARLGAPTALAIDGAGAIYITDENVVRKAVSLPVVASIVVSPENQTAPAGQRASFRVVANGNPAVTYQWQRSGGAGGAVWSNLSESGTFAGVTTAALAITNVSAAMNGDQFRCVVANSLGTAASAASTLAVDPPVVVVPLRVATFAGEPGAPNRATDRDGQGRAARFIFPDGVAIDAVGNLYVAETAANLIRKVTRDGAVTTFAGSGVAGGADGTGRAAQFNRPSALALDSAGNIFVADAFNGTIRRITPAGVVTTFAGLAGSRSIVDGTGSGARFFAPSGLAFDRAGNLFVIDATLPGQVRRISQAGVVVSLAALPAPVNGQPSPPLAWSGITIDTAGNFFFTTTSNTVEKWSGSGTLTRVAGQPNAQGSTDGRAANARFNGASGIVVDAAGNIYVAEAGNATIRRISPSGMVSTVAGVAPSATQSNSAGTSDGIGGLARLNGPRSLAMDRAGNIFIADTGNNAIRKASSVGSAVLGQEVAFSVLTVDEARPSSYQWRKNSVDIPGATAERFAIAAVREADRGDYSVLVGTQGGVAESAAVPLTVDAGRITNLSIRAGVGAGAQTLIVGFVAEGFGLPLLVRGVGPGLANFGVMAPLADPRITLFEGNNVAAANDNWGGSSEIREVGADVGAFSLAESSLDSALLASLSNGGFTVQCTSTGTANGVALVELYDAGAAPAARLVNVSARSHVGTSDGIMIAGFAVSSGTPRRVLIRGVGPTLAQFGVAGALSDPQLKVFDASGALRAQNDDWNEASNAAEIVAAVQGAGAFVLPSGSKDAALVLSLSPGNYSVHLSGAGAGTGVGLIEVYELK